MTNPERAADAAPRELIVDLPSVHLWVTDTRGSGTPIVLLHSIGGTSAGLTTGALANANYDYTKLATDPALQRALQAMSSADLQRASTNISTWIERNCVPAR